MRRVFCDVCGTEIADRLFDGLAGRCDIRAVCPNVKDVCPGCAAAMNRLDVEGIVLDAWRSKLKKKARNGRKAGTKAGVAKTSGKKNAPAETDSGADAAEDAAEGDKAGSSSGPFDAVPAVPAAPAAPPIRRRGRPRKLDVSDRPAAAVPAAQIEPVAPVVETQRQVPAKTGQVTSGKAADKARIMRALVMYRAENGVGSLNSLADAAGVTSDQLRRAIGAERFEFDWWLQVEAGLKKLGRNVYPAEP